MQHLSCRVFSFPIQGGTNQPIGDKGDSGATFIKAVITSKDPPPPPPPHGLGLVILAVAVFVIMEQAVK